MAHIVTTGLGDATFEAILRNAIRKATPNVLGVAVAYVSILGFDYIHRLTHSHKVRSLRLVTDIRDGITHPAALSSALANGWDVRVVASNRGTFHPKLYIGGESFNEAAGMSNTSLIIMGSGNLSAAALQRNAECSYVSIHPALGISGGLAWRDCWAAGSPLTANVLSDYETYFAQRNQFRPPADLVTLGVADVLVPVDNGIPVEGTRPPPDGKKAIPNTAATTTWAGLQSFTGDYNLQVEFPRDAGAVLLRLLRRLTTNNRAEVLCEDGQQREFIFRYYKQNGMFRLNVHNTTPGVDWVRQHRNGLAVVEVLRDGTIRFRIVKPGGEAQDIFDRSLSLGTWGQTPTRYYGWY